MSKVFEAMKKANTERAKTSLVTRATTDLVSVEPAASVVLDAPVSPSLVEDRDLSAFEAPEVQTSILKKLKTGLFGKPDEHLVSLLKPNSLESEQYRALRFTVERMKQKGRMEIVALTSAAPGDGKTLTALNLAGALAPGADTPVLIVDADLRGPSVTDYLQMSGSARGLVEAVSRADQGIEDYVLLHPRYNIAVFPAGADTEEPYEVLKSTRLNELLQQARRNFQYIIVDTPPLIPYPDCRLLQKQVDGFLVVVGADRTPKKLVEEALRTVDREKVLGMVFNGDQHNVGRYYSKKRYGRRNY